MPGAARGRVASDPGARERLWPLLAAAVVVVGLAAWRATIGMSMLDDGYYAAATMRLVQGARILVDEKTVQSLGFLAILPFAKLWTALFGLTGFVAALRVAYVAVAAVAGGVVYRLLRPSFGRWASFVAVAAPLLAPPYNLLAVSYDTTAALGLVLACVLAFAAMRDGRRLYAAASGTAAALATISYPPLVLVAVLLLVLLAVRSRDRRLVASMALGALGVVAIFLAWLLSHVSLAELRTAYDFVVGSWGGGEMGTSHGTRLFGDLSELGAVLSGRWGLPLWAWFAPVLIASASAVYLTIRPSRTDRARGIALACLPFALLFPVFAEWSIHGRSGPLWTIGGNYLIEFVLFAAPPMYASLRRAPSAGRDLAALALPVGALGFAVVMYMSAAGISRASGVAGLAPLVVAVVAWWTDELCRTLGAAPGRWSALVVVAVLLALLFGSAFKDGAPLALRDRIAAGPYAGVTTSAAHAEQIAAIHQLAGRWVSPDTRVTVFDAPGAYLLTGGVPLTDVTWLSVGPSDALTLAYYDRAGRWPDVVFIPLRWVDAPAVAATDPFLSTIEQRYRLVERSTVADLAVFVAGTPK